VLIHYFSNSLRFTVGWLMQINAGHNIQNDKVQIVAAV
jgi:hypothetical protein